MLDLTPFCGAEETRPYLHEPFNYGGHTYATNGHILIRVERRDGLLPKPHELSNFDGLIASLTPRWLDPDARLAPIPAFTLIVRPAEKCGTCSGSGRCECECCADEHQCGLCDGSGTTRDELRTARFPSQDLKVSHVDLIRALPSAAIAFGEKANEPAVFRFDGGVGCVMPMLTRDIPSPQETTEPVNA